MGITIYKVKYESTGVDYNHRGWDKLHSLTNESGNVCVDREQWEEFLEENPDFVRDFPEMTAQITEELKENNGCIELDAS